MLRILAATVLAGLSPLPAAAQEGCLTLDAAVAAAVRYDPRIDGASAQEGVARAEVMAAHARNLPQVSAFGSSGLGDTPPLDRRRDDAIGVQLDQELFSFGARAAANAAARSRLEAARHASDETEASVAQGAALAYLEYVRARSLLAVARQQEEAFRADAETAATRLERSVITLTDASQIRARYAVAQTDRIDAEVAAATAEARLSVLTGLPVSCAATDSTSVLEADHALRLLASPPESVVHEAMVRSAALRQAKAQTVAARATVTEASRANMPTLSLNAFHLEEKVGGEWVDDSRVGFQLSQQLFTGGRNEARKLDARARLQRAQSDERLERLVVEDSVRRALAQASAQREAALALADAGEQAALQLENAQKEYDRGTKTLTDLVLATETYFSATSRAATARYDYHASLVRLYTAMNMLTGEVLR